MDAGERRAIEEECKGLVVSLVHHSDHGEDEAAVDLFAADGTWVAAASLLPAATSYWSLLRRAPNRW